MHFTSETHVFEKTVYKTNGFLDPSGEVAFHPCENTPLAARPCLNESPVKTAPTLSDPGLKATILNRRKLRFKIVAFYDFKT